MKKSKDVEALAASFAAASAAPLVPVATQPKKKTQSNTLQVTLRPARPLFERYVDLAAERSKKIRRTVTAQEIMLEVLEGAGQ